VAHDQDRVVWCPKDLLLWVLLGIPIWGIGGLGWGLVMALFMQAPLFGWLFAGLLWGAAMWVVFTVVGAVASRELSTRIPLPETASLPQRLAEAVQRSGYVVEQQSPVWFVGRPKYGLIRLFECSKLHVVARDGGADLTGPVFLVRKVRKKLLAGAPAAPSGTTTA
jgi:hypothetical protein